MQALFKTTKKKTAAVAIAWNSVVIVATAVFCNIEHTRDR